MYLMHLSRLDWSWCTMTSAVSKQIECGNAGECAETGSEEMVIHNKPGRQAVRYSENMRWVERLHTAIISPETFTMLEAEVATKYDGGERLGSSRKSAGHHY